MLLVCLGLAWREQVPVIGSASHDRLGFARDGLGGFVQNQLRLAKEGGNFGAGRFVQGLNI